MNLALTTGSVSLFAAHSSGAPVWLPRQTGCERASQRADLFQSRASRCLVREMKAGSGGVVVGGGGATSVGVGSCLSVIHNRTRRPVPVAAK